MSEPAVGDAANTSSNNSSSNNNVQRGIAALQRFSQKRRGGQPMRFNPFGLLQRKRVGIEEHALTEDYHHEDAVADNTTNNNGGGGRVLFDVVEYSHAFIPDLKLPPLYERSEVAAATAADLLSAEKDAVDNTGAYHWAAEDILAHFLVTSSGTFDWSSSSSHPCTVLELGAGVGLAGFFIALSGKAQRVVVTDGNRRVTQLLAWNARRVSEKLVSTGVSGAAAAAAVKLEAMLLPWQNHSDPAVIKLLQETDYIVGADTLFFEDFHPQLAELVLRFFELSSSASKQQQQQQQQQPRRDRKVVFIAPERGGSMQRFLAVLDRKVEERRVNSTTSDDNNSALFVSHRIESKINEQYDPLVFKVHQEQLSIPNSGYVPDRHFPKLLCVTAVRRVQEEDDGAVEAK